ncbi:hypothetical protein V500_02300 [Pseudogymnoascus sp. VKM F-4518 (FW-2643)]|nr:hypothetical protein V500_02300 [Pseudogymnoascus sp. VKM F-4518 (FW-2643)]
MVGTRKTPSGRTTVTLDGSPVIEAVDDEDDTIDITDQFSVPRSSMPPYSDRIYASPYQSGSVDLQTPLSALTPSSYASPSKRPATPPPALNFDGVPNLPYFRGQWVYVGNLERLDPKLSWEAFNGSGIKWLAHNNPDDLYNIEELGPLGIILLGQLGRFTTLKSAENNFNKDKPEFSLQLQVEERSLEILKVLIRRRDRNLTVTLVANPHAYKGGNHKSIDSEYIVASTTACNHSWPINVGACRRICIAHLKLLAHT